MLWNDIAEVLRLQRVMSVKLSDLQTSVDRLQALVNEGSFLTQARFDGASVDLKGVERSLAERLEKLEAALIPLEAARVVFFFESDGSLMEVTSMQMVVDKALKLKIAPVDKFGNPAKVDGMPAWSLTDPALGALVIDADGMGAMFTPAGTVGALSVQVNADADLGDGVKTLAGDLPVELLAGEAVAVNVSGEVV
jgi:hypothetical protein